MVDETANIDSDDPREADFEGQTLADCNFEGLTFKSSNFAGASFTEEANFKGATFVEWAKFDGATFTDGANFDGATFTRRASFEGATFTEGANFRGATFERALFSRATFNGGGDFRGVTFTGGASFLGATFAWRARFARATFNGGASFSDATFTEQANFEGATFASGADFSYATFTGLPYFVNADMQSVTHFRGASFVFEPPRFFGAKLHEGTVWRDVTWPDPPKDRPKAGRFVDAYERLKLEMDRLKKHGDELDFFARELQCRRVLQGEWGGLPIAAYGFLSDYGRSYVRPLLLLAATVLVGAFLIAAHLVGYWTPLLSDPEHARQAIGISFTNTLGLLGKPLMKPNVLVELPDWLKAVATIQSILGIVLLFLFGLGIRNRFRMK